MADRAPAARPRVALFDVFETLLQLEPLRERLREAGRPAHELELFFARTLRDGMAYSLAGQAPPFAEVARAQLATTSGHALSGAQIDHILAGFAELPAQPDAAPALDLLAGVGIPCYAFTHGSARTAESALGGSGLLDRLAGVLSAERIASFKPPARVYHWACEQAGVPPADTVLVAVHSWDTHGAVRAGLLAGFATRHEGAVPAIAEVPHVVEERLDAVARGLLDLGAG